MVSIKKIEPDKIKTKIKILMLKCQITEREIAERLGTSPQMICDVIARRKNAPRYEKGIAEILGVSNIFKAKKGVKHAKKES